MIDKYILIWITFPDLLLPINNFLVPVDWELEFRLWLPSTVELLCILNMPPSQLLKKPLTIDGEMSNFDFKYDKVHLRESLFFQWMKAFEFMCAIFTTKQIYSTKMP